MNGLSAKYFDDYELLSLEIASGLVAAVDTFDQHGRYVRCHELARAAISFLGAHWKSGAPVVEDGSYSGCIDHSWIRFWSGNILDVYVPWRSPQVQLVFGVHLATLQHYRPGQPRSDIRGDVLEQLIVSMQKAVPG